MTRVERLDADDRPLPAPDPPAFGAPNGVGFLMYDPAGFMGVVIMQDGRTPYADTRPTADEARMALSSYTSYFGPYTIDETNGVITHHVEGSLGPNGTGVDNRRAYEFVDDDTLVLCRHAVAQECSCVSPGDGNRTCLGCQTRSEGLSGSGDTPRPSGAPTMAKCSRPRSSRTVFSCIPPPDTWRCISCARGASHTPRARRPTRRCCSHWGQYASYFGPFVIDPAADEDVVVHNRIGHINPRSANTPARRGYEFRDNTLILQPPATMVDGREVKSFLTWTKIE